MPPVSRLVPGHATRPPPHAAPAPSEAARQAAAPSMAPSPERKGRASISWQVAAQKDFEADLQEAQLRQLTSRTSHGSAKAAPTDAVTPRCAIATRQRSRLPRGVCVTMSRVRADHGAGVTRRSPAAHPRHPCPRRLPVSDAEPSRQPEAPSRHRLVIGDAAAEPALDRKACQLDHLQLVRLCSLHFRSPWPGRSGAT